MLNKQLKYGFLINTETHICVTIFVNLIYSLMEVSRFSYIFHSLKYGYLLYNSRTNSFAEINKELFDQLTIIKNDPSKINSISVTERTILEKAKVIVPDNEDDNFILEKKLANYTSNFNRRELGLVICPTIDCNFDCIYCFEVNKKHIYMNSEVEDNIIQFINKHQEAREIQIIWYGGEPLLGFKSMRSLYSKIKAIDDKIITSHGMVTNGYLLDKTKFDFFKENPLDFIQISIDGLPETHNKMRRHKNPNIQTYDKIVNNIDAFSEEFPETRISIRIHVENNNQKEFIAIYNLLSERWENRKNIQLYPAFIVENTGENSSLRSSNCISLSRDAMTNFYIDLYKNHGFNINFYTRMRYGGCSATRINGYIVGPRGELYKCWDDVGIENKMIGNINDDKISNIDILSKYLVGCSMFDDSECRKCVLFPVCSGGCQMQRIKNSENTANYDICNIRKDNLSTYLELHYEQRKKQLVL